VEAAIRGFVAEAAARVSPAARTVYAALCCTHFGYCRDLFVRELRRHCGCDVAVIDPNERMALRLASPADAIHERPDVVLRVVSKVPWEDRQVAAYGALLRQVSPESADALAHYRIEPELFTV
jgi:hypothetical protein